MKVRVIKTFSVRPMAELGGENTSINFYQGSTWTALATIACPEDFECDYPDEDGPPPDYYVIWNGKMGLPVLVSSEYFKVIG